MDEGAEEFVNFLLALYDMYPEFKTRELFITGQSFAGKYLPLFGYHILNYNNDH
jgi:carboxypeptidase C (cathepsin A)